MRPIIPDFVKGEVRLPASKSISNRVLILDALSGHQVDLQNLSDSDDTRVLRQFLQSPVRRVDVGLAGTAMRFLAAFLAARQGTWELTGSPRMCRRPMAPLVEALNALGARVGYVATPGCPPLRIEGMPLAGGEIEMPASVSSQFVSALMMVAPGMRRGLVLHLAGKVVSAPYIRMTGQVMHEFGIEMDMRPASIRIPPQVYRAPRAFRVEPDWTAASYFYELLAVARDGAVALPGLQPGSLQGDAAQVGLWERLGVRTHWTGYGVCLEKQFGGFCAGLYGNARLGALFCGCLLPLGCAFCFYGGGDPALEGDGPSGGVGCGTCPLGVCAPRGRKFASLGRGLLPAFPFP